MDCEADMVDMIRSFLEKQEFRVATEVPMLSKKIDIVCIDPGKLHIIAIEVKMQEWRRGLQQAITYRICSDFVYLAIHRTFSHRVDKKLLQEMSVGLMVVDRNGVEIAAQASSHMIFDQELKKNIQLYCRGEHFASF